MKKKFNFRWLSGLLQEEKNDILTRQEEALDIYKQWISLYQDNKSIGEYLKKNKYYSVAIYGLGRAGKNLFDELKNKVKIDYVIDQRISMETGNYLSVLCYNPKSALPKTDLIIVTVAYEGKSIISKLSDCGTPMITLQKLIKLAGGI